MKKKNRKKRAQRDSYRHGLYAEFFAAFILILKGYRILKMRYKTHVGEVDIIARKRDVLAFIEVKARQNMDDGLYAVTPRASSRIARAAASYIQAHTDHKAGYQNRIIRFDVFIFVTLLEWRHLDNAWQSA